MLSESFFFNTISLGNINVQTWGFLVVIGFIIGLYLCLHQAKKANIDPDIIINLALIILFGGIIGARMLFLLDQGAEFIQSPIDIIRLGDGGLALYGGFIGSIVGSVIYFRVSKILIKQKLNILKLTDLILPNVVLAIAIGRLGCFFINDHLGLLTKSRLPWMIDYGLGQIRHPVALYMVLSNLVLFLILITLKKYTNVSKKVGSLTLIVIMYETISRFSLDFFRATEPWLSDSRINGLTYTQWISLVILIIIIVSLCFSMNKRRFKKYAHISI